MITAQAVELRIGARVLLEESSFRIAAGDRIGLVGRNGAGKTTLTKTLAGETQPTGGQIVRSGDVGYLPQDPRTGDLEQLAMDRVLSARGLDEIVRAMRATETAMASEDDAVREKAMDRYSRLDARFNAAGGYAAESEAHRIASNLGLDERVLGQTIGTLSGGQRRRVELARILFSGVETLLLDEPTNHLDADSIMWLRDYLKSYSGGLIVISHDADLLRADREQGVPPGRQPLAARPVRPRLGRVPAAARDGREAPPPRAGQRREEGLRRSWRRPTRCAPRPPRPSPRRTWPAAPSACCPGLEDVRASDKVAHLRFPEPAACGKTPLTAADLSKTYGSQEVFTGRRPGDRPGEQGRRARPQRRRQDDAAAHPRRRREVGHRRGPARVTASSSATTRRSTRRSTWTARSSRT